MSTSAACQRRARVCEYSDCVASAEEEVECQSDERTRYPCVVIVSLVVPSRKSSSPIHTLLVGRQTPMLNSTYAAQLARPYTKASGKKDAAAQQHRSQRRAQREGRLG